MGAGALPSYTTDQHPPVIVVIVDSWICTLANYTNQCMPGRLQKMIFYVRPVETVRNWYYTAFQLDKTSCHRWCMYKTNHVIQAERITF